MKRIFLVLTTAVPLLGCGTRSKEPLVFDKVEIERLLPLNAKTKTTIQDRQTVASLVEYFPEMGRGKSSDIAGGWKAAYRLRFVPSQGNPIKVTVDSKGELWSEGNGDWRAKPGLREHLDNLFKKSNEKQAQGDSSEPANGPIDPKHLAKLAEQLRSKKWDERSAALASLEKMIPAKGADKMDFEPVIEPLFDCSGWGGLARRDARRAEELFVRIGGQAVPLLRRRLGSHDAHDRRVAAELLSRIESPGPGLTELLRPLLSDPDRFVRRAAMQGLGAQGQAAKAAISDLEKASSDPILPNRATARVALIHIAGPSEERIRALADLLLLKEPCEGAAAYAATELGKLGRKAKSAAPQLLEAVKHTDAGVRGSAAGALVRIGADPEKAVAVLIALLKDDPEREVRRSAAGALGELGPSAAPAIPSLRQAMRGDGGGWWVAVDAIGKIGGRDAMPALIEALECKDDDVRLTAIKRLGDLGGAAASAAKALEKARKDDPREWNRKAAAEALKKIR